MNIRIFYPRRVAVVVLIFLVNAFTWWTCFFQWTVWVDEWGLWIYVIFMGSMSTNVHRKLGGGHHLKKVIPLQKPKEHMRLKIVKWLHHGKTSAFNRDFTIIDNPWTMTGGFSETAIIQLSYLFIPWCSTTEKSPNPWEHPLLAIIHHIY